MTAHPDPAVPAPSGPTGPTVFARYALAPNRLGYCGPDDWQALADAAATGDADGDAALRQLARGFEGAYPYLETIARASGIADPLDRRVVDAYWLGGPLLASVDPNDFSRALDARFGPRVTRTERPWLLGKPAGGGRPSHAFHVLEVFPRIGLLRGGRALGDVVEVMDSCRIRVARVTGVMDDTVTVMTERLEFREGKLGIGPAVAETLEWGPNDRATLGLAVGDDVSVHWGRLCDRLVPPAARMLAESTRAAISLANRTI